MIGQCLDIAGYQDSRNDFWLAYCQFAYGKVTKELSKDANDSN